MFVKFLNDVFLVYILFLKWVYRNKEIQKKINDIGGWWKLLRENVGGKMKWLMNRSNTS